jgi:mitogen-activated protein kinase 15
MASVFPAASPEALDFISRCLVFNPSKRMTVDDALKHAYVSQFHSPADEPRCPRVIAIQIDDNIKYTAADYRDRLYREIARKKKEARARRAARAARSGAGAAAGASATSAAGGRGGGGAAAAAAGSSRGRGSAGGAAAASAGSSY